MTREEFEHLSNMHPLMWDHYPMYDPFSYAAGRSPIDLGYRLDLKFTLACGNFGPDVQTVALMYYQFDQFMRENFKHIFDQLGNARLPEPTDK